LDSTWYIILRTNLVLHPSSLPCIFKTPIMLMGADVTHSPPGEGKASIAA
jgi:hypothetical protein